MEIMKKIEVWLQTGFIVKVWRKQFWGSWWNVDGDSGNFEWYIGHCVKSH